MLRLVAYDISSPRILRKIAKVCLDYGIRIEKSVFECDLSNEEFEGLWQRLCGLANAESDYLVCYPICANCRRAVVCYGQAHHQESANMYVI